MPFRDINPAMMSKVSNILIVANGFAASTISQERFIHSSQQSPFDKVRSHGRELYRQVMRGTEAQTEPVPSALSPCLSMRPMEFWENGSFFVP